MGTGKERRQNEKKLYLLVSHKRIKKKSGKIIIMVGWRRREMKEVNKNFAQEKKI